METIVNYYKLCTVAAGGRAHSAVNSANDDKKMFIHTGFVDDAANVREHVVGGSSKKQAPAPTESAFAGKKAVIFY